MEKLDYVLEKTNLLLSEVDNLNLENKTNTTNIASLQNDLGDAQGDISSLQNSVNSIQGKISNLVNPNLLINGDFRINQRGKTSYTGSGNYSVDRWKISGNAINLDISNEVLTGTTTAAWNGIKQILEFPSTLAGKAVTASFYGGSGSSGVRLTIKRGNTDLSYKDGLANSTGILSVTTTIPSDISDNEVLSVDIYNKGAETTTYNWCKLEVGEIATQFTVRPYAEEFNLCQRFYQTVNNRYLIGTSNTTSYILAVFQTTVSLRKSPNLTVLSPVKMRAAGTTYTQSSASTNAYFLTTRGGSVSLNNFSNNPTGVIYTSTDNIEVFELDAEI